MTCFSPIPALDQYEWVPLMFKCYVREEKVFEIDMIADT
jgi:hypothetical protein